MSQPATAGARDLHSDQFCGACHNGEKSFSVKEDCQLCHQEKRRVRRAFRRTGRLNLQKVRSNKWNGLSTLSRRMTGYVQSSAGPIELGLKDSP